MRRFRYALMTTIITAAAVGAISVAPATSHEKATGVVKERMELMKANGKAMKAMGAMVKGESPYDADQVRALAEELRADSAKIPDLFPEGSLEPPSEALPAIWQNWAKFEELARRMGEASGAVADAADGGLGAVAPVFGGLAKTCSACHTDFRKKKE